LEIILSEFRNASSTDALSKATRPAACASPAPRSAAERRQMQARVSRA